MTATQSYVVDISLLEAKLASGRPPGGARYVWWVARHFALTLVAGFVAMVLFPALLGGDVERVFTFSGRLFWIKFIPPLALAIWFTVRAARLGKRHPLVGATEMARRIESEYAELVGPGWIRRALRSGLVIGAAVGIPIGVLLAFAFSVPSPASRIHESHRPVRPMPGVVCREF